ncbi:hypothetical protein E2C01_072273 [Portunus trituberculatus]|uniref:Uncharacterized protein n=1 Tax=Portunus trituberculatus TaxID=210409 RepID=A0A5B7I7A8_PORTR|nr:hypothetical protein [Portunus trituberculatus]
MARSDSSTPALHCSLRRYISTRLVTVGGAVFVIRGQVQAAGGDTSKTSPLGRSLVRLAPVSFGIS